MPGKSPARLRQPRDLWPAMLLPIAAVHLLLVLGSELSNDALMQSAQIAAGRVNDWHPPAATRLWQALGMIAPGPLPMQAFSVLLYWGGFAALAIGFARLGKRRLAVAAVGIGLFAAVFWFEPISKDSLLAAFFTCGFGIALNARIVARPSRLLLALAATLFVAGVLMRHNGSFALGPALLLTLSPALLRRFWLSAGISVAVAALVVPVSQIADRQLFGAVPSRVEDSLFLFDMAGIAHHTDDPTVFGPKSRITRRDVSLCYSPVMWDSMAPWGRCPWFPGKAGAALVNQPEMIAGQVPVRSGFSDKWLRAVLAHPIAYATHRVRHMNAELMLLVSTRPRNGIIPVGPGVDEVDTESQAVLLAKRTVGVVLIPGMMVALAVVAFAVLIGRIRTQAAPGIMIVMAYAMSCSALLYAGAYLVLGVATAQRYYFLTGLLALLALAVAFCDDGVCRSWRNRRGLRVLCIGIVVAVVALAEIGRLFVPVPPAMPIIAAQ